MEEDIRIIEMSFVNAFLVKTSDGFILIDTGLAMFRDKLENGLLSAGCTPGKLRLVVITHGDFDHIGNCSLLQEKYHCKIAMHKDDSAMAENLVFLKRKTRTFTGKVFTLLRKTLRKLKGMKFTFEKFTPDLFLNDNQRLDEFGFKAMVIHIPGHTKGSIGLLTDEGALFAGDTFTNRRKPDIATYVENSAELENSIRRLKTLPVKTVYPGHGKPFEMKLYFK